MRLEITDNNKVADDTFLTWLLEQVQTTCLAEVNVAKLDKWSVFLTESQSIPRLYSDRKYSAQDLILEGIYNLEIKRNNSSKFVIQIDPRCTAKGYDRLNLASVCRLINYGNTELLGCPIFTNTFNKILKKLPEYVVYYYGGL